MIRNQITLKQIEALVAVADLGTFRKAATALGTTQPNVSVRIAALETTLGVVLMRRDAGSVRLTETGEEVLEIARGVLQGAERLLEVTARQDLITDQLRLGVTELIAGTWLHSYLRALKQTYPSLRISLTVDLSAEIEKHLSAGALDLAISNGPYPNPALVSTPLDDYRYGWVTTPEMAAALGPNASLPDMLAHGLLSHGKNTAASVALRDHLTAEGLPPDQVVHANSLTALMHMAVDGFGIAALPRQLYKPQLAAGRLVEVPYAWSPRPLKFYTCYHKDRAALYVRRAAALSLEIAQQSRQ